MIIQKKIEKLVAQNPNSEQLRKAHFNKAALSCMHILFHTYTKINISST